MPTRALVASASAAGDGVELARQVGATRRQWRMPSAGEVVSAQAAARACQRGCRELVAGGLAVVGEEGGALVEPVGVGALDRGGDRAACARARRSESCDP